MNFLNYIKHFFVSIFQYREYLIQSVARDLSKKYKRSILGYFWSMLNPLLMMAVLALVFSNIMKTMEDYAVFLFCGMLPWSYFSSTCLQGLHAVKGNIRIIAQIPVPKYLFLLSLAFSNLYTFAVSIIPLLVIMLFMGRDIPWQILALPIVLLPLLLVTIGISLLFAVSNVFFDDTEHLSGVIMQALYFLCPVLYGREILPEGLVKWLVLNPMFCVVEFMRDLFYFGRFPDWTTYGYNLLGGFVILLFGLYVFKKADQKFIYFV